MLEAVKTRLRVDGRLTPEIERRILEFERICLSEIRSERLRAAVLDYLEHRCPIEFYTAPASSTGGRHPEWQSLPGGILLNTVECCIGADRKIRMHPGLTSDKGEPKNDAHDAVYVATVLSDTFKTLDYGKPFQEWSHHIKAAVEWEEISAKHQLPAHVADSIASAIRWHLGRFTPDWPAGKDPRSLDLIDFIVHELDMDFSNRRLTEVFERRLGEVSEAGSDTFLEKEFETASGYFQHVEGKLNNLLVFFSTLLVAVITACYYIASTDTFKNMTFVRAPRSLLIGLVLVAFAVIGLVFVGVYTELRVRKIRMLEEMAAIRGYAIDAAARKGQDIRRAILMVSSVPECPPYLRRPSEDWYTLLLMTLSSATAFAVAFPFLTFEIGKAFAIPVEAHGRAVWAVEGLIVCLGAAYLEFAWFTQFCYRLDVERQAKFAPGQYVFFSKHGQSFPGPLRRLDSLANWIERRYSARKSKTSKSASGTRP